MVKENSCFEFHSMLNMEETLFILKPKLVKYSFQEHLQIVAIVTEK